MCDCPHGFIFNFVAQKAPKLALTRKSTKKFRQNFETIHNFLLVNIFLIHIERKLFSLMSSID